MVPKNKKQTTGPKLRRPAKAQRPAFPLENERSTNCGPSLLLDPPEPTFYKDDPWTTGFSSTGQQLLDLRLPVKMKDQPTMDLLWF